MSETTENLTSSQETFCLETTGGGEGDLKDGAALRPRTSAKFSLAKLLKPGEPTWRNLPCCTNDTVAVIYEMGGKVAPILARDTSYHGGRRILRRSFHS